LWECDAFWGSITTKGEWRKKRNSKGQLVDGPKEKWRPDLEVVKATVWFLEHTGRLNYHQQVTGA
jgi:hypothetical protein